MSRIQVINTEITFVIGGNNTITFDSKEYKCIPIYKSTLNKYINNVPFMKKYSISNISTSKNSIRLSFSNQIIEHMVIVELVDNYYVITISCSSVFDKMKFIENKNYLIDQEDSLLLFLNSIKTYKPVSFDQYLLKCSKR